VTRHLYLSCVLLAPVFGQVPDQIDIQLDGKPFTVFHAGADAGKPYFAPLRSASGTIITRRFPMEKIEGESQDHLHHRGLWFCYDDVNGVKFWENDPSYKNPKIGRIVAREANWKPAAKTFEGIFDWNDPAGKTLLTEHRVMKFQAGPKLRIIDLDITLTAREQVVFGDTKEGAFAIRLADALTEKSGSGKMVNDQGQQGMANVWGTRFSWVDYSGSIDGEKLGVAIFDNPSNPGYPSRWHARDYGLFALNPWGQHGYDPAAAEAHTTLASGASLHFRWRVVIHEGDAASAHIAELYKEFVK
jgi:hypothetical protein